MRSGPGRRTFAREWADAAYEKGETQSFYNEFFEIFGVRRRAVARYEEHVTRLDDSSGFIDLFWPGVLLVEQKSAGRDLEEARVQAGHLLRLPCRNGTSPGFSCSVTSRPSSCLTRDEREETRFALADLPQHVEKFGFIIGVQRRTFRDQDPVNIEASELVARLHDALKESGYSGNDLQLFLVRIVFCLFADDTGIFEPRDIFLQFMEDRTAPDGSDLGPWLARLFQVLNTPVEGPPNRPGRGPGAVSVHQRRPLCGTTAVRGLQCRDALNPAGCLPLRLDRNLSGNFRGPVPVRDGTRRASPAGSPTTRPRRTSSR